MDQQTCWTLISRLSFTFVLSLLVVAGTPSSARVAQSNGHGCVSEYLRLAGIPPQKALAYERSFPSRSLTPSSLRKLKDPLLVGFVGIRNGEDQVKLASCNSGRTPSCKLYKFCTGHGQCRLDTSWTTDRQTAAYMCRCEAGYSGSQCDSMQDPCLPNNPCAHGGICRRLGKGSKFVCDCAKGYVGPRCQNHILTGTELGERMLQQLKPLQQTTRVNHLTTQNRLIAMEKRFEQHMKPLQASIGANYRTIQNRVVAMEKRFEQNIASVQNSLKATLTLLHALSKKPSKGLRYFNIPATWHAAKTRCAAMGGVLASPRSVWEHLHMRQLMERGGSATAWIGVNDIAHEGHYTDPNGGYTNPHFWAPDEPNNHKNEDCVLMAKSINYKWNDGHCAGRLQGFICRF